MRLSARILKDVGSVNNFDYAQAAEFTAGDSLTVYFQLVDLSVNPASEGFVPAGRRYMPASGATLMVTLDHVNDARKILRAASQPYPSDPSIWMVSILPGDALSGTVNMKLVLTEGAVQTQGMLQAALAVQGLTGLSKWS